MVGVLQLSAAWTSGPVVCMLNFISIIDFRPPAHLLVFSLLCNLYCRLDIGLFLFTPPHLSFGPPVLMCLSRSPYLSYGLARRECCIKELAQ